MNNNGSDLQQTRNNIKICESDIPNNITIDHCSNQIQINSNKCENSSECNMINGEYTSDMLFNKTENHNESVNSSNNNNASSDNTININNNPNHIQLNQLTYASTESQTDDLPNATIPLERIVCQIQEFPNSTTIDDDALIDASNSNPSNTITNCTKMTGKYGHSTREQWHVQRREQRIPRSNRLHNVRTSNPSMSPRSINTECEILPDILHNHIPPAYTTLPMPSNCRINAATAPPTATTVLTHSQPQSIFVPGPPSSLIPVGISDDGRYTFPLPIIRG